MFMSRSEYDSGAKTFSPEGRLFQVEYAMEAIKLGTTAIGLKAVDGIVLAVEKPSASTLVIPTSTQKIEKISTHIGAAMSGMTADARSLVDRARIEAQNHYFTYDEPIKVRTLSQSISRMTLAFSDETSSNKYGSMSRPFGVAMLIGGIDGDVPKLYQLDPSGTFIEFKARSIGSAGASAETMFTDFYKDDITVKECLVEVFKILKQTIKSLTKDNVEVAIINKEKGYHMLSKDELNEYISNTKFI
ncbi:hypothetical protein A3Q56_00774, partial [Intoshia linei]